MHPILRKQLQTALSLASPEKARLEALVASVHQQYRSYERELKSLESRLADYERQASTPTSSTEGEDGLRVLLDNIKDSILSVDVNGRIRSMNVTGERMFGRAASDLVGESIGTILLMPPGRS